MFTFEIENRLMFYQLKNWLLFSFLLFQALTSYQQNFKDRYYIYDYEKYQSVSEKADKSVLKKIYAFKKVERSKESFHDLEDQEQKLYYLAHELKKSKLSDANDFLNAHDSNLSVHEFYLAFSNFMFGYYKECLKGLNSYSGKSFRFYANLLKADCLYELNKEQSSLLNAYQMAYDDAADEIQKKIVRDRIKYIRYKYD